jgi:AraC-like DNA-binding protein
MARRVSRVKGQISARMALRVVQFVAQRGHDAESLYRSVGLHLPSMKEEGARVPYAVVEELGERAAEMTGDPNIGLHLAGDVRDTRNFDAGVLLLMASPTVRAVLARMTRYQRYWGDTERSKLLPVRGGLAVRWSLHATSARGARHIDECAMAEIVLGLRVLTERHVVPRVVRFRHASPADRREHDELFDCSLVFGAQHTELELDDAVLEIPMPQANEAYASIFLQQVERAIERLPRGREMAEEVRAVARAALAGGACTLATTARSLGISARTLQRRLHADGTSFGALLDALRCELALGYLQEQRGVMEIAMLIGFSDGSAFHHAFKRWTGTTPERYRNAALPRGSAR